MPLYTEDTVEIVKTPPVEEPKPEQETQLTEEEVAELVTKASEALFGPSAKTTAQKAKEKTYAEAAKKVTDDKAAADAKAKEEADKKAAAEKAKPEPEKKTAPETKTMPTAAPATADEIADRVAQRMVPKAEKVAVPELSDEDKASREVISFMAKEDPDKYGRLLKRFDAFIPAEKAYREKWEKANPGETFDAAADDHKDFYATNDPITTEADQEAFDEAKVLLKVEKKQAEREAENEQKRQYKEAAKTVEEKLKGHKSSIMGELLKAVDPDLAKLDLSKKKLREEDPIADAAIRPYVPALAAMTGELVKAFTPGLNYQFRDSNPIHVELIRSMYSYENELLSLPAEEQKSDDGRLLAPIEDFNKMSDAQKAKHWTIWMEPNAVKALLIRDFAAKAKEDLALYRSKTGKSEKASAEKSPPKKEDEKPTEEATSKGKKEFPNTVGGAENGTMTKEGDSFGPSDVKSITHGLFGS